MIGKILSGIVLVALITGSIFLALMSPGTDNSTNAWIAVMSTASGAGFVFLLNLIGLGFRPKYFGAVGIVLSGLILAYGIYVLVTKKSVIVPIPRNITPVVGGISTGVGGVAFLTSVGILTR